MGGRRGRIASLLSKEGIEAIKAVGKKKNAQEDPHNKKTGQFIKVSREALTSPSLKGGWTESRKGTPRSSLTRNSQPSAVGKPKGTCCQGKHDKAQIMPNTADSHPARLQGLLRKRPSPRKLPGTSCGQRKRSSQVPSSLFMFLILGVTVEHSQLASTPHINMMTKEV